MDAILTMDDGRSGWSMGGVPERLGPYVLGEVIGWGGMGAVFEALDERSGEAVAIKLLRSDMGVGEQERRRFHQEVAILRELRHPGIVPIRDSGSQGSLEYLVMDLIRGETLSERLNRTGPLPWVEAIDLAIAIARAVSAAHEQDFVHRDLKPGNILIGEGGRPYVADFGIARTVGVTSSLTASGTAVGTPEYMSPEQSQGRHDECTPASDVWSLGVLLYEMISGVSPFRGETALDSMVRVNGHHPPSLRRGEPGIPTALDRIVMQCLERSARRRYADAGELAHDLERLRSGERVSARSCSGLGQWCRRLPPAAVVAAAGILLLALVGGSGAIYWSIAQRGTWVTVAEWDFTNASTDLSGLRFAGPYLNREDQPWHRDEQGLLLQRGGLLWLREVDLPADVRVDLELHWGDRIDGMEVYINSRPERLQSWSEVPVGYSCQIGGWKGLLDLISRNESHSGRHAAGARYALTEPGSVTRLSFYRQGDRFVLKVEGRDQFSERYPLPIDGSGLGGVGLKTFAHGVRLRQIRVSRRVSGSLSSPLTRADTLAGAGAYASAAEEYLAIAEVHSGPEIAAPAFARAFLALHQSGASSEQLGGVRQRLAEGYPDSEYHRLVMEVEVLDRWRAGDEPGALEAFDRILDRFGSSRVLLHCLDLRRAPLTPQIAEGFLRRVAHDRTLGALDLKGLGLRDLSPLAGLPLAWLHLGGNRIEDLSDLAGMPLRFLDLGQNPVRDLRPLAGAPLHLLHLADSGMEDLRGLEGAPIEELWASRSQLRDLSALAGCSRLSWLGIEGTAVADLTPLAGLHLTRIHAQDSAIHDLTPLQGMPLRHFDGSRTAVSDLTPVIGPSLQALWMEGLGLSSVEALRGAPALRFLFLADNDLSDLEPLRGLRLQHLTIEGNRIRSLEPIADCGLEGLACHRNPVVDLGWLVADPPAGLVGPPVESLSERELEAAIAAWEGRRPVLAMYAATQLAVLRDDPAIAARHAVVVSDQRVAIVAERSTAARAESLISAWGVTLATPVNAEHIRALGKLAARGEELWTGLASDAGGEADLAGHPVASALGPQVVISAGKALLVESADHRAWLAIAWPLAEPIP